MAYRRGDVIAVPYEYSDLSGGKVRPAVIISSDAYNLAQPDIVVAGVSTQIHKASAYDYLLKDWAAARLRYPSLVRGRLLTLEQSLVRQVVGRLTAVDFAGVEDVLAKLLFSDRSSVNHILAHVELTALPGQLVQALAAKSIRASLILASRRDPQVNLKQLQALLSTKS
ncbi:MAG: type II toxin-antitoxin system PemK/MazF family toxin [Caldilinea sp. CFX5]|nr:type II toxin-antitoxin system PemK/MazF family toxin [Caldilinea sp. CFX5]